MASNKYTIEQRIELIETNLKGVRDEQIRKRAYFLLTCLKADNIKKGAESQGHPREYYYFWINRLINANFEITALLEFSRTPKTNPNTIDRKIIEKAIEVRDKSEDGFGAQKVAFLLERDHNIRINGSTLGYIFLRENVSKKYKKPKKKKHTKRYAAEEPLERTQADTKGSEIKDNNGNEVHFYPVIDDCTRLAIIHVADEHSNYEATKAAQKYFDTVGIPQNLQTDNGTEYTYKYISELNSKRKKDSIISGYEILLKKEKINHILIKPRTPQLNGKVERFNQTIERECEPKIKDGLTIAEIQKIVDDWVKEYNTFRPHSSLNYLTPHQKFYGIKNIKKHREC